MAALKQRHDKWEARVRVPKAAQEAHGGKEMLYRTLQATERRAAKIEAMAWEAELKAEWEARRSGNDVRCCPWGSTRAYGRRQGGVSSSYKEIARASMRSRRGSNMSWRSLLRGSGAEN